VKSFLRPAFVAAVVLALGCFSTARAQLYLAYAKTGIVSEYDEDTGALVNETLILGLKQPRAMCLEHGVLYVLEFETGHIGTYDIHTGAAIHPELVTGLNQAQTLAVSGDAIYVGDFNWQTSQPQIGKYNAFTGATINAALVKITGDIINGMNLTPGAPNTLAVSGNHLLVSAEGTTHGLRVYDTTTGEPVANRFLQYLNNARCLYTSGPWLYMAVGAQAPTGTIFKLDPETGKSPFGVPGLPFPRPMIGRLDYPTRLAVSGDSLFISGAGTAVGKYNATTGDAINATFIPSKGDAVGGLAVVPRAASEADSAVDSQFEWKRTLFDWGFALLEHGDLMNVLFYSVCTVLTLVALGCIALALRQPAPPPADVATGSSTQVPPTTSEETPPAEAVPTALPPSRAGPRWAYLVLAFILLGFLSVAYEGYSLIMPTGTGLTRYGDRQSDIIGGWGFENNTRDVSETPVLLSLEIYPHEIQYSEGNGSYSKPGTWHDNAFWIANANGTGEIEVARVTDPLDIEVHVGTLIPGRSEDRVLYKEEGSAAERAAIAAKYPPPHNYPPPKGVITYYMSEYDLISLPWRADYLSVTGDEAYSRGLVYHYHSDDPKIPALDVTVKNRKVVEISGGYE
jgi:hypothetical protein